MTNIYIYIYIYEWLFEFSCSFANQFGSELCPIDSRQWCIRWLKSNKTKEKIIKVVTIGQLFTHGYLAIKYLIGIIARDWSFLGRQGFKWPTNTILTQHNFLEVNFRIVNMGQLAIIDW